MKKVNLLLVFLFSVFVACDNSVTGGANTTYNFLDGIKLQGSVVTDYVLEAQGYELEGVLIVKDGATLTIPAGTVIKATSGTSAYIAVEQGAKININGTSTNPVVMTSGSSSPKAGDWGGLIIAGKANTNKGGANGETATTEVAGLTYGGTIDNDNSGVIQYLRLEYTGAQFTNEKQFNGLSLFGVGSGTTIEYVQSYKGEDDGIEFFGGSVNGKYLISTDSGDDGIDFADGWSGTGENWYIKDAAFAGIEGSNNGDNGVATPMTTVTLKNISVVVSSEPKNQEGGLYIKEGGGKWTGSNIFISGYATRGLRIKELDADAVARLDAGDITFNSIQFDNSAAVIDGYSGTFTSIVTEGDNTGSGNGKDLPTWASGWAKE